MWQAANSRLHQTLNIALLDLKPLGVFTVFHPLTGRQAMTSFRKTKPRKDSSEKSTQLNSGGPAASEQPDTSSLSANTTDGSQPLELLTKEQVCDRLKVCIRKLDQMVSREEFPKPVRLGKRDYWSTATVNHWLSRRFAVQEAWRIS